jgi:hypothetical protein
MNWKPAAMLPLILAIAACASEGGSRGSGISTSVTGNVNMVQAAASPLRDTVASPGALAAVRDLMSVERRARARTVLEGIAVAVEGTAIRGQTDANGQFALQGNFDGRLSLLFQLPDAGGSARLAINVPAGGTLTLHNVRLDTAAQEAVAETQGVDFDGIIITIDCNGLSLTMVSAARPPGDTDQYTVRLDTSSLQDTHGNSLECADLRSGEQASVQGRVNPDDGSFGDAVVEVKKN